MINPKEAPPGHYALKMESFKGCKACAFDNFPKNAKKANCLANFRQDKEEVVFKENSAVCNITP